MRIGLVPGDRRRPFAQSAISLGILLLLCGCSGIVGSADWHRPGWFFLFAGSLLLLFGVLLPERKAPPE